MIAPPGACVKPLRLGLISGLAHKVHSHVHSNLGWLPKLTERISVACRATSATMWWGRMPESKGKGLEKDPKCVKRGSKMRFSCTEPELGQPGFVHHIYECTKCRSTQSFVTPV
jgi:hypothetical protein